MFTKTIKTLLSSFVSFSLVFTPVFASEAPNTYERTAEKIQKFLTSGSPSDIPFLDYTDNFTSVSSQPLKQFNLSSFVGKKLFVGYGTYDTNQNYCRYIEKPGSVFPAPDIKNISKYNNHSYASSLTTMDYNSCVSLANKYGGKPVILNSAAENGFISGKFRTTTGNGINKWIGINKTSCLTPYKNINGGEQDYFNWSSTSEQVGTCDNSKLYTKQNPYGTWNKVSSSELNYCVIEVDSEEFTRPIKVCAPWWKIEREYDLPKTTTFRGIDVYRINQADIPDQFDVCIKYKPASTLTYAEAPNRIVTCTSYYDSTIDPVCIRDPYQAICKVDECSGYIKNACTLKDSFQGFKNYTKTETGVNGTSTIQKGKAGITTNVYSCPPSLPSSKNCEEQATVLIYPKECPGSSCEAYKTCYANASTAEERTTCATNNPCEKIYGNPDNPRFNADGTLRVLIGICSNGSELEFDPNIQAKDTRKCLEYEKYTITEDVSQKCLLDRPYTEPIIDTSLTEEDIYQNNPNCVRMNNVKDARPIKQVLFNYKNNGYAKTVIRKSLLDGSTQTPINMGDDSLMVDSAMNTKDVFGQLGTSTNTVNSNPLYDCSMFEVEAWYDRQNTVLNYPTAITVLGVNKSYLATSFSTETSGELFARFLNVDNTNDCNSLKAKLGGTNQMYTTGTKECKVYINKYTPDIFSLIKGNGSIVTDAEGSEYPDYTYITKDPVTKEECKKTAYCLNGIYNETAYVSASSSQCSVTMGDGYEYKEDTTLIDEITETVSTVYDSDCRPFPTNGAYSSDLDGTKDIFSVQEVVTGTFGYFSNYNSHPYKNNFVTVNGKEVSPIKKMPELDDPLIYEGNFQQWSITTKKPALVLGAIAGAGVGVAVGPLAAGLVGGLAATGIGLVVFVVVAMIFGKVQKFNRQKYDWTIYKLVPTNRYIVNVYGYDKRVLAKNNGTVIIDAQDRYKLIYANIKADSGTLKPGDFQKFLKNMFTQKQTLLKCLGWTQTELAVLDIEMETKIVVEYPKCTKLSFSCNKTNDDDETKIKNPFFKRMNNNYIGAVNSVTIVVPYLGDYQLQAYDAADNLLGQITIKETEFLEATSNVAKYAQVPFGLGMNLADGINEGLENNACRSDLMVEWGGGISGIYYENNNTGNNQDCQKSHDSYVQSKSATKIKIKALNMDRPFVVELARPLPFPNRVFLATLNEKEIREYRCYDKFGECKNDSYK